MVLNHTHLKTLLKTSFLLVFIFPLLPTFRPNDKKLKSIDMTESSGIRVLDILNEEVPLVEAILDSV